MIVSIFSREKHFPLRIFARCIAFTMQFNDSRYCFKDRRYSSYISSRKRDARRENRDLVARFQHGGIASLPAIIRGIEISEAFEKSHRQWKYFSLACSSLFIIVLYSFFFFLSISFSRNSCNAKQNRDVAWDHSAIYFRYWRIASDAIFVVAEINWIITFFPELKVSFNQFCKLEECKYIFFSLLLFFLFFFCTAITFVERTRTK